MGRDLINTSGPGPLGTSANSPTIDRGTLSLLEHRPSSPRGQRVATSFSLGSGKTVVFSFDDGPLPKEALLKILSILKINSITAEFFVLGGEVSRYPEGARKIVAEGHQIQNHSWSHVNLKDANEIKVERELSETQKVIKEVTGRTPTIIRPPYGAGGFGRHDPELAHVAKKLSLTIRNWDIDTNDWKGSPFPRGIGVEKIKAIQKQFEDQKSKHQFNILMHVQKETADDLEGFIKQLKNWGFSFAKP